MVESNYDLDFMFAALADSTRRSILELVAKTSLSIGEIAEHYKLTFGAISKHILFLEKANLVSKYRRGKEQVVVVVPETLSIARLHIEKYEAMLQARFDRLETLLKEET